MAGEARRNEFEHLLPISQSWGEDSTSQADPSSSQSIHATQPAAGGGSDYQDGANVRQAWPDEYWRLPQLPVSARGGPISYDPEVAPTVSPTSESDFTFTRALPYPSGLPALGVPASYAGNTAESAASDKRSSWGDAERKKSLRLAPGTPGSAFEYRPPWGQSLLDLSASRTTEAEYDDSVSSSARWQAPPVPPSLPVPGSSALVRQASWPLSFLTTGTPTSSSPPYSPARAYGNGGTGPLSHLHGQPGLPRPESRPGPSGYVHAPRARSFTTYQYDPSVQLGLSTRSNAPSSSASSYAVPAAPPSTEAEGSTSYDDFSFLSTSLPFLSTTPALPTVPAGVAFPDKQAGMTYPIDVSTPYIPRRGPGYSDAVIRAAAYRQSIGKIDLTGRFSENQPSRRVPTSQSVRRLVDLGVTCLACHRSVARLSLRGGQVEQPVGDDPSKYDAAFYCTTCVPLPPYLGQSARGTGVFGHEDPYAGECTYYDSLSCAVDRYLGEDVEANDTRPPPVPPAKARLGFVPYDVAPEPSKKRKDKVVSEVEGMLACMSGLLPADASFEPPTQADTPHLPVPTGDVCRRDVGSGQLRLAETGEAVGSTIEVLCAHCDTRYLRCSDCGGGGGNKGVGRWRCKEMLYVQRAPSSSPSFCTQERRADIATAAYSPVGRKTCQLPHSRLGLVDEMD